MDHKPDCPWKDGFYESITAIDSGGPDICLSIDDRHIFKCNLHGLDPKNELYIGFNFCPMCGVSLKY